MGAKLEPVSANAAAGATNISAPSPETAAVPTIAIPARNFRRPMYNRCGVTSDHLMSEPFLISIKVTLLRYAYRCWPDCLNLFSSRYDANHTEKLHGVDS